MDYYNEIKNKLVDNEIYSRVKECSEKLMIDVGKKYKKELYLERNNFIIFLVMKKCQQC